MPVSGHCAKSCELEHRNVIDGAKSKAVPDVATQALFGIEISVVLWDGGFVHGSAEVGSIGEILRVGVVREEAEAMRIASADIDVASVVPTLRGVFQQIDGAHRKGLSLDDRVGTSLRQRGV